jgi:hypothetical protein
MQHLSDSGRIRTLVNVSCLLGMKDMRNPQDNLKTEIGSGK